MLPFYTYDIDENDRETGMDFNSLVLHPAHGKSFLTFSKQTRPIYAFNEERREVMGVLIAAGLPIYRNDNQFGEYYGVFTKTTITKIKEKLFRSNHLHKLNIEHNRRDTVKPKGVQMTDLFQVDSHKGIGVPESLKGQNVLDGSLIGVYKIHDEKTWQDVKSGKYSGFSIEAMLDLKPAEVRKQSNKHSMSNTKKKVAPVWLRKAFGFEDDTTGQATFEEATTVDGKVLSWEGQLAEGTALFIDLEGEKVAAPEGDHQITMGEKTFIVTLDAAGIVTSMEEVEEMTQEEQMEAITEAVAKEIESVKSENAELKRELAEMKTQIAAFMKHSKYEPKTITDTNPEKGAWRTIGQKNK